MTLLPAEQALHTVAKQLDLLARDVNMPIATVLNQWAYEAREAAERSIAMRVGAPIATAPMVRRDRVPARHPWISALARVAGAA